VDLSDLHNGFNIEKLPRAAKGRAFAVNAYFRQSCEEPPS